MRGFHVFRHTTADDLGDMRTRVHGSSREVDVGLCWTGLDWAGLDQIYPALSDDGGLPVLYGY